MSDRSRTTIAALVSGLLVVALAPGVITTGASWTDSEWEAGTIATSTFDCAAGTGYATSGYGRFLSGGVLGVDLDSIVGLASVSASRNGPDPAEFAPAGAQHVPDGSYRDSFLDSLDVTALGAIGIDLSGMTLGLPVGSAGALGQYAQVTSLGYSAGASGLITSDGGVGVTVATTDDELPGPATIGLDSLVPSAAGISGATLEIGAVAASSVLDWCGHLENLAWGHGTLEADTRDYGIASLDLTLDTPIATLVPGVQAALSAITTGIAGLQGTSGGIASAIGTTLTGAGGVLAGLDLGATTGSVVLGGLDLGAVEAMLSGPGAILSDGVVTIDLTDPAGTLRVDLAELVGGPSQLNDLPPNTELVIDAAVINDILTRVGDLVQGWVDAVTGAVLAALAGTSLEVDMTTRVGIDALGIDILTVRTQLTTQLSELMTPDDTPPVVTVTATALNLGLLGAAVAGVLATLGLGSLAGLVSGINSSATLPGDLLTATSSTVSTALVSVSSGLTTDLTNAGGQLVTALGTVLTPLPTVLSVMVNVQPDLPGAPPGSGFAPGAPPAMSQQYLVTALRVGLLDGVVGAPVYVNLATASAGPNALLP